MNNEEIKIEDGKVSWKYDGKKHSSKLAGKVKIFRANHEDGDGEERPVVKLDLTFNGFVYKDVEFGLSPLSMVVEYAKANKLKIIGYKKFRVHKFLLFN